MCGSIAHADPSAEIPLCLVALEGEVPQKINAPLCLSYHPSSPLTDEEVMARARG